MAIKLDNKDLQRRVLNGVDAQKVMLNGIQIWPETPPTPILYSPWLYHNPTLWLISFSSDWNNWLTMQDKEFWATEYWGQSQDESLAYGTTMNFNEWNNQSVIDTFPDWYALFEKSDWDFLSAFQRPMNLNMQPNPRTLFLVPTNSERYWTSADWDYSRSYSLFFTWLTAWIGLISTLNSYPVRLLKTEPVVPDSTWIVLYQPYQIKSLAELSQLSWDALINELNRASFDYLKQYRDANMTEVYEIYSPRTRYEALINTNGTIYPATQRNNGTNQPSLYDEESTIWYRIRSYSELMTMYNNGEKQELVDLLNSNIWLTLQLRITSGEIYRWRLQNEWYLTQQSDTSVYPVWYTLNWTNLEIAYRMRRPLGDEWVSEWFLNV